MEEMDDSGAEVGRRSYDRDRVSLQYFTERLFREVDRRLEKMDKTLEKLDEQQELYITRADYDRDHGDVLERVGALERWQANLTGRTIGVGVLAALLIATLSGYIGHLLP